MPITRALCKNYYQLKDKLRYVWGPRAKNNIQVPEDEHMPARVHFFQGIDYSVYWLRTRVKGRYRRHRTRQAGLNPSISVLFQNGLGYYGLPKLNKNRKLHRFAVWLWQRGRRGPQLEHTSDFQQKMDRFSHDLASRKGRLVSKDMRFERIVVTEFRINLMSVPFPVGGVLVVLP